jgi:hypothetical protein
MTRGFTHGSVSILAPHGGGRWRTLASLKASQFYPLIRNYGFWSTARILRVGGPKAQGPCQQTEPAGERP